MKCYGMTVIKIKEYETTAGIELRLEPSTVIHGTVMDVDGDPIAGAKIFLGRAPSMMELDDFVARTDTRGAFTLDSVSPDIKEVSVVHPPYAPGYGPLRDGTTITLEQGSSLEGIVRLGGKPLSKARINITFPGRKSLTGHFTTTSTQGKYRAGELNPGDIEVRVRTQDNRTITRTALLQPGETSEMDFDFSVATSAVHGQIFLGDFSASEIALELRVETSAGVESHRSKADPDGSYRIDGVGAGLVMLSATVMTGEVPLLGMISRQLLEFQLEKGVDVGQDFYFTELGIVSGNVLGIQPEMRGTVCVMGGTMPVPDDLDFADFSQHYFQRLVAIGNCDENGHFNIQNIVPGEYTVIAISNLMGVVRNREESVWAESYVTVKESEKTSIDFDFR